MEKNGASSGLGVYLAVVCASVLLGQGCAASKSPTPVYLSDMVEKIGVGALHHEYAVGCTLRPGVPVDRFEEACRRYLSGDSGVRARRDSDPDGRPPADLSDRELWALVYASRVGEDLGFFEGQDHESREREIERLVKPRVPLARLTTDDLIGLLKGAEKLELADVDLSQIEWSRLPAAASISRIRFRHCVVPGTSVPWVESLPKLRVLPFVLGDDFRPFLRSAALQQRLTKVGLMRVALTDDDVRQLQNFNGLHVLAISNSLVSDQQILSLSRIRTLAILEAFYTPISPRVMVQIQNERPALVFQADFYRIEEVERGAR